MAQALKAALDHIKTMEAQLSSASGTPSASAGSLRRSTQLDAATIATVQSDVPAQVGKKILCKKTEPFFNIVF